jgi:hypothetical protein
MHLFDLKFKLVFFHEVHGQKWDIQIFEDEKKLGYDQTMPHKV